MERKDIEMMLSVVESHAADRLRLRNVAVVNNGGILHEYLQREMTNILLATLICQNANYREDDKK